MTERLYKVICNKGYPSERSIVFYANGPGNAIEKAIARQFHNPNTVSIHVEDY